MEQAKEIVSQLNDRKAIEGRAEPEFLEEGVRLYKRLFAPEHGGFGDAPKFPTPYNILFLLAYYRRRFLPLLYRRALSGSAQGGIFNQHFDSTNPVQWIFKNLILAQERC